MSKESILIGGACGYWGEATHATEQLLTTPGINYLVYDYLAEITLSIMARARNKDPLAGFATDFVTEALTPNLQKISASGVRVISNAGGMNPGACAQSIRDAVSQAGLSLQVAVVEGDDLKNALSELSTVREMFSDEPFPDTAKVLSANAYLGAFPIAAALDQGADIVITGRCVDSALTLAACINAFNWQPQQLDLLAAGSLAGHLVECGPQASGGNFTDWHLTGDNSEIGYPLARVYTDGHCVLSKPADTSGVVSVASVAEQMLYEIGDPTAYLLPDVTADFSQVSLTQLADNEVEVTGAIGYQAPSHLKASVTWHDGYRAGYVFTFNGVDAPDKAKQFAQAGLDRARRKLELAGADDYEDTCIEVWGGQPAGADNSYQEVMLKTAVRHQESRAVGLFLKETMGAGLSGPPGLAGFTGAGRPRPSPVVRLFSCLVDRSMAATTVKIDGKKIDYASASMLAMPSTNSITARQTSRAVPEPVSFNPSQTMTAVTLEAVAVARSGDKGDNANVGVIARSPELLPWIWQALDECTIKNCFGDLLKGAVHRYYLPGSHSINIVLVQALGGGGIVSLRNDAQGKGYAQMLLATQVSVPASLLQLLPSPSPVDYKETAAD